jgi:integrase/recombinase XerD
LLKNNNETQQNNTELRNQTKDTKFKDAIKKISKIIRSNHFTYQQTKYIFSESRLICGLESKQSTKGIKPHLSQEDARRLIDFAYQEKSKLGILIKTLLFTGTRVSEFTDIKISDVYLNEKKIIILNGKGGKSRYVPIFAFYLDELRTYIGERREGYLFETRLNTKYSSRRIQQILKQLVASVGINGKITPHRLRATIATWLFEKGMSKDDLQLFLGHEKPETTQIYIKGSVKHIGDAGDKLLIEGNPS